MTYQFDLNKPSHLIANDVIRQLELLMSGSGLHVTFGTQTHHLIEGLVAQYQDKLMEAEKYKARSVMINPDKCRKCGHEYLILDTTSGIRTCSQCGEGQ